MVHIAEVKNGIVVRVIVACDNYGNLTPEQWAANNLGGRWIRTELNPDPDKNILRKNYAGIGYIYDEQRDAFIPPDKPFDSWILDEETCRYKAPVDEPIDGIKYNWDEDNLSWKEVT